MIDQKKCSNSLRSLKSSSSHKHFSVMFSEVLKYLKVSPGKIIVDGTVGLGGHSKGILRELKGHGKLVGFEWDKENFNFAQNYLKEFPNCELNLENFSNLEKTLSFHGIKNIDGILLDLGLSSVHLDNPKRGFSFRFNEKLDMRMNLNQEFSAVDVLQKFSAKELRDIFWKFGEEKLSKKIADRIVESRENGEIIDSGEKLLEVISNITRNPKKTAARIFQALRIEVNSELENLEKVLPQAVNLLSTGGRIVIISFHSLEDRIVKKFFKKMENPCLCPKSLPCVCGKKPVLKIVSKKPVLPSEDEILKNSRSRSAKMRVAEKIL